MYLENVIRKTLFIAILQINGYIYIIHSWGNNRVLALFVLSSPT